MASVLRRDGASTRGDRERPDHADGVPSSISRGRCLQRNTPDMRLETGNNTKQSLSAKLASVVGTLVSAVLPLSIVLTLEWLDLVAAPLC